MASYQNDFLKNNTPEGTYSIIMRYVGSDIYNTAQANWEYFNGNNVTISKALRYYYSEGTKNSETGKVNAGTAGFKINTWSANNKIGYSFFKDMITQKVDTLFREAPTIESSQEIDSKFIRNFGFAMKVAAERASAQCYAYILTLGNTLTVFSADRAIAFFDDDTGELKALIRWWYSDTLNNYYTTYWEVYEEDGVTTYRNRPNIAVVKQKQPYKYKQVISAVTNEINPINIGLPIVEFRNTYDRRSDMTNNIRAKIDIIDAVESGFANNIEDFSDVFITIKNSNDKTFKYDADYLDYLANFSRTHIAKEEIAMQQFNIPTEARSKFVEMMKQELIQDGGIMDMTALISGNATATAMRIARVNLETRVSAFEWTAYETACKVIEVYQRNNGMPFDFDVTFNKYTITNETEIITNANMLYGKIPDDDYYRMLKAANVISRSPQETIAEMQRQNLDRYGAGGALNG